MFTGYSALKMAEALDGSGELLTCEIDPSHISIAKNYFQKVPWGKRITVLEGTALESLANLEPSFDLVFIDADKINYLNYYKRAVELIRSGGIIVLDNALWSGRVIMPEDEVHHTQRLPGVSNAGIQNLRFILTLILIYIIGYLYRPDIPSFHRLTDTLFL